MRYGTVVAAICGAALALGGCGGGGNGGAPTAAAPTDVGALTAERDEARAALEDLRESLASAQEALASATAAGQRSDARAVVVAARQDWAAVRRDLEALSDSDAKTAASAAFAAVDAALALTAEVLAAPAAASGGLVSPASMHTTLDRAQTALDNAQARLKTALASDPSPGLRTLLSQAQATLSTAQISLVPSLRRELADAEREAAAQRARAGAAETERDRETGRADAEKARADAEKARADAENARAGAAETERDGETERADAEKARADAEKARADAEKARADTYDPRVTIGDPLTPLRGTRVTLPESLESPGSVTWTRRTDAATGAALDNSIETGAVLWTEGYTLIPGAGNARASAEEFAMRGVTVRGDQFGWSADRSSNDGTINPPVMGSGAGEGGWSSWDATYESSIRMNADGSGVTLEMGGDGTIFYDFERVIALGPGAASALNRADGSVCANTDNARCDDIIASDATATFGPPVADPDGEAAWYFRTTVPVNPDTPHTEERDYRVTRDPGVPEAGSLPYWARFADDTGYTLFRVSDPNGPYTDADGRYRVQKAILGEETLLTDDVWEPLEFRRARRIERGRPVDEQGVYNLWLSNYAGGGEGTESRPLEPLCRRPHCLPSDYTAQDNLREASPHRYLAYAAYGLFNFLDYSTPHLGYSRLQAFHFGFDAFSDAPNRRPADWGTAAEPITATFTGKTSGWLMQAPSAEEASAIRITRYGAPERLDQGLHGDDRSAASDRMIGEITRLVRLRGDVELTAVLNAGGANGQGTISGGMWNFEFLHDGVWGDRYLVLPDAEFTTLSERRGLAVVFERADIEADGSFGGTAAQNFPGASGATRNFADGEYGGAFYGPRELGELEAAGHWMLPVAAEHHRPYDGPRAGVGMIIGSFGARSEEPGN